MYVRARHGQTSLASTCTRECDVDELANTRECDVDELTCTYERGIQAGVTWTWNQGL